MRDNDLVVAASWPDSAPDLPIERGPQDSGVGSWVPRIKHTHVAMYLHASRQAWKRWPTRVLIDPFCGPGRIQVRGESATRDGGAVVACRQMIQDGAPFTAALVGDIDEGRANACASRLQAIGVPAKPFVGPASQTVEQMIRVVPPNALCFAYVDPYNLEFLEFGMLRALASLRKVDLAVHFSTMDLHRNVEMEFDPTGRARFDGTAPQWREKLDLTKLPKSEARLAFFQYWLDLVHGLDFEHSKVMPLVPNDSGSPIYRLVFFARHKLPLRIWGDVAQGPQRGFDF